MAWRISSAWAWPPWPACTVAAALLVSAPAFSSPQGQPPAETRGVFRPPHVVAVRPPERFLRLAPNAILGWEVAAIAAARVETPTPITLPGGAAPIPAGTAFLEEVGPGGLAACLYPRPLPDGSPVSWLCLTDTDGDGRSDRLRIDGRTVPIAPVQLRPVADVPTTHPGATTIERRLYVKSIDERGAMIVDHCAVRPGEGLPRYMVSSPDAQTPRAGPGQFVLPLREGRRITVSGLTFETRRGADAGWWVRVSGALTPWVRVLADGTIVESVCGRVQRMR